VRSYALAHASSGAAMGSVKVFAFADPTSMSTIVMPRCRGAPVAAQRAVHPRRGEQRQWLGLARAPLARAVGDAVVQHAEVGQAETDAHQRPWVDPLATRCANPKRRVRPACRCRSQAR
jgi:hypothetical protein